MKKKLFSLIFVSVFMILSFVGGALALNADTLFLSSTEISEKDNRDDQQIGANATGNWIDYGEGAVAGGSGTYSDPYKIGSSKMLANLLFMVNDTSSHWISNNGTYIEEAYYILTDDIDMSAHYWTPIGNGSRQFKGKFNGNGYTISGLIIDCSISELKEPKDSVYGVGLFGIVDGATIENLYISDSSFTINRSKGFGVVAMGSVVGLSISNVTINNVISTASFNLNGSMNIVLLNFSSIYLGGIAGSVFGTANINNCANLGSFYFQDASAVLVGGIISLADKCSISFCMNMANISGKLSLYIASAGGIVDNVRDGNSSNISDCVNYGYIKFTSTAGVESTCVGGIVGLAENNVIVRRCINYGNIQGSSQVGGIAGKMGAAQETKSGWFGIVTVTKEANENVAIANCINYGTVSGSTEWGGIVGQMNGRDNIKGCYVNYDLRNRSVGLWQYANGKKTDTVSVGLENVDWWNGDSIYSKDFYMSPYSWHSNDFDGNIKSFYCYGWKSSYVYLNGGYSSYWTITTLLYDYYLSESGTKPNFVSTRPYSLVPSWIIGTGRLTTEYYRASTYTSYPFIDNVNADNYADDKKLMKIYFNKVDGREGLSFKNATFYYIKGVDNSTRNSLEFEYDTSNFTSSKVLVDDKSSGYGFTYSRNGKTTLSCSILNKDSVTVKAIFKSVSKPLTVRYCVGDFIKKSGNVDAHYDFSVKKEIRSNSSLDENDEKFFQCISGLPGEGYFKESISGMINPNYGYAVLYVLYQNEGDADEWKEGLSKNVNISKNRPNNTAGDIIPSTTDLEDKSNGYGKTKLNFQFDPNKKVTIFLVPIRYSSQLNIRKDGQNSVDNLNIGFEKDGKAVDLVGYQGHFGYDGLNSTKRRLSLATIDYASTLGYVTSEFKEDQYSSSKYSNQVNRYLRYGYEYSLYAYCDTGTYSGNIEVGKEIEDVYLNGTLMLGSKRRMNLICNGKGVNKAQLNTSQALEMEMYELISKAVNGNEAARSNRFLHIVIEAKLVDYSFNFVNMVDSYGSPKTYEAKSLIGGESSAEIQKNAADEETPKLNVAHSVTYNFKPKPGYKHVETSFTNIKNSNDVDVTKDKSDFQAFLDDYMKAHKYDVDKVGKTLNVYVYYQLQTYEMTYESLVYNLDGPGTPGATVAQVSINGNNVTTGTEDVCYYKPLTLNVGNVSEAKFLGWYLIGGENDTDKLLSLQQEYKFLLDPEIIEKIGDCKENCQNKTHASGDGGYKFKVRAVFSKYSVSTNSTSNAGSAKVIDINSEDDLLWLSDESRTGNTFDGCLIRLQKDLNMSGKVFDPIGTKETPFKGIFDGQNHIISNLKFVAGGSVENLYNVGLFGYTQNATIKNLTIRNSNYGAFANAGIFVAEAKDTIMQNLTNFGCNLTVDTNQFYNIYGYEVDSDKFDYALRNNDLPQELIIGEGSGFDHIASLYGEGRESFGGLVGKMNGGSIYASAVNANLANDNAKNVKHINGLVGQKVSGQIDQCGVDDENGTANFSVTNVLSGVTDCYYRYGNKTKYVYNGAESSVAPTGNDKWVQLANGLWTLKVLYWL